MNKYLGILIVMVLIVAGGVGYSKFLKPEHSMPMDTGKTKEFVIVIKKESWSFDPGIIDVDQGDKVRIKVINHDDFDHGIAIDAFGVSQRIPANGEISFDFVATQAGEFTFYCSVPCGDGVVAGVKRGHFDQFGKIVVHSGNMHDHMDGTHEHMDEMMN